MNSKIYRCGWCGSPTDETGRNLEGESFKKAVSIIDQYGDGEHTYLVNGYCCPPEQEQERMQVTRDMAIDAGDPSLEGQWI